MIASLKRAISRILFPDLTALHWRCYRKALTAKGLRGSILRTRVRRLQRKFCADVPIKKDITPFTTPHGLSGIFISKGAVIGEGCTLFQQVTIGSNTLQGSARYGAPILGRNVYIGAGAKIIGRVTVGDNVILSAGCVLDRECVIEKDSHVGCACTVTRGSRVPAKMRIPAGSVYENK